MEHVWTQTVSFSQEPDVWETLSHHKLNLMLMPGPHTKPVYVTCTWCARAYLGMPNLPLWSEVFGREDSGAETEQILSQSSQESEM
eukprot:3411795-Rhodomonas_salina.1